METRQRYKKRNYRTISLMNIYTKVLNKYHVNQIQQDVKRIIHLTNGVYPGKPVWFNIQKSIDLIHHMGMLIDAKPKAFDKFQHFFMKNS
jgi:hypothetical protein